MSRVCFVDPVGGVAGDMLAAALIDAGADELSLLAALGALVPPGWRARTERVWRGPFAALRFVVELEEPPAEASGGHDHAHHAHDPHHAHLHHAEAPSGPPAHPWRARSRHWLEIDGWLGELMLEARPKARARAIFAALARAEGRVHGIAPEQVSFHEVGALDSIVDVLAVVLALEALGVDQMVVGPLPLGRGHTTGEHGWIPLPAPATLELLNGFVVEGRSEVGETVTPTGAALLAALAVSGPLPAMRVAATGVGAGSRDPAGVPNVVRVVLGEGAAGAEPEVAELRADVDGLTGEAVPALLEALFAAGAIDASAAPVLMKKGRPGFAVVALAAPGDRERVGRALLLHGRSLGYRWQRVPRVVLARRWVEVETGWGRVRMKIGEQGGERIHAAPEYEDCASVALAAGVPWVEVHARALAAWFARPT